MYVYLVTHHIEDSDDNTTEVTEGIFKTRKGALDYIERVFGCKLDESDSIYSYYELRNDNYVYEIIDIERFTLQ